MERYISDSDVSKDGIQVSQGSRLPPTSCRSHALPSSALSHTCTASQLQTPKTLLVVGGSGSTLACCRAALDSADESTGTALPCMVVADSGGAAEDIWRAHLAASTLAQEGPGSYTPVEGGWRDAAYVQQATALLDEIITLGSEKGNNSTEQLSFFRMPEDPSVTADLGLDIQNSLLNDCPDVNQEALLAVAWAEPAILRRKLEEGTEALLGRKDTTRQQVEVDLFQVALMFGDVDVMSVVLEYVSEPFNVQCNNLFVDKFCRYRAP